MSGVLYMEVYLLRTLIGKESFAGGSEPGYRYSNPYISPRPPRLGHRFMKVLSVSHPHGAEGEAEGASATVSQSPLSRVVARLHQPEELGGMCLMWYRYSGLWYNRLDVPCVMCVARGGAGVARAVM